MFMDYLLYIQKLIHDQCLILDGLPLDSGMCIQEYLPNDG